MNKKITQFKWLAATLMLVAAMVMPSTAWAQTMYTVFDTSTGTLTFKYDSSKPSDTENVYEIPTSTFTPGWITAHASDIKKVVFDESFAKAQPTMCYSWFSGCSALEEIEGIANLNTSEVDDMRYMFHGCSSLTSLDLSGFDTHKVEYMNNMFLNCKNLKTIFVSDNFVTNVVKSSSDMFSGCTSIEGAIIYAPGKTDAKYANYNDGYFTKKGTVATPKGAYALYTEADNTLTFKYGVIPASVEGVSAVYNIPISSTAPGWKTAHASAIKKVVFDASFDNVRPTKCFAWFDGCSALKKIEGIANLNTSEVDDMQSMFSGCSSLTSLDLSGFDTQKVKYMDDMFLNCNNLKTIFVSDKFVTTVQSSSNMFSGCTSIEGAIIYDPGKTDAKYANYTDGYFTKKGTVATPKGAYAIYTAADNTLTFNYGEIPAPVEGVSAVYKIPISSAAPGWKNAHASAIKRVVFDASFADVRPTKCYAWFYGCSALEEIEGIANLNTSEVNDMRYMFYGCSSLTSLDLSGFDTQKVKYMDDMFRNCKNLKTIFVSDKFVTNVVNSSSNMFSGCTSIEGGVAYSSGNANDATFAKCTTGYFTNVSEKVNYVFHAVYNSSSNTLTFKYGNKTKLDTGETAYELNTGETAPGWISNTGITKVVFDMSFAKALPTSCFQWFKGLSSLTTIEGIGYLNTSEVTDMNEMFSGCSSLLSLQLKAFNTVKVTDMTRMFYNCSALISIYTSDLFVVSAVSASDDMFTGCTNIVGAITYDSDKVNKDYANSETGYFIQKPEGEGTSESPYLISNAADLVWFRDHVNQGNKTACARLEADIDMSSVCHAANESEGVAELSWVPISDNSIVGSKYWYGTFDGNNKTLSNLYINTSAKYSGLFGYIYNMNASERGTIKNIIFEYVKVTSSVGYLGVLAGYARNTDISGITVNNGTVNGTERCGGIVGYIAGSSLSCCINKIDIIGGSSDGNNNIGGIVGFAESSSSITNCANYGNVKGYRMVGGIAGSADVTIENVFSSGNVTCINTLSAYTGLVVGQIISNVTISGNVIYNSEAKLSYGTTAQATKAFGRISSNSTVTESDATGMTKERLASGEVCYLLNGSSPNGGWGQQIGTNDYPLIGSPYKVLRAAQDGQDGTNYWATFSNLNSNAELIDSKGDITVYNATVSAGTLTLTKRSNKVSSGEGVLLKATSEYVNAKNISDKVTAATTGENDLVATPAEAGVLNDTNYKHYRLTYNDVDSKEGIGFYLGVVKDETGKVTSNDGSQLRVTPGKAYLKVTVEAATEPSTTKLARGFAFPGDGETTGIECITVTDESLHSNGNAKGIFDLQGRKVSKPTKGVYINNGKKVIIK